jgi:hypothetical protein
MSIFFGQISPNTDNRHSVWMLQAEVSSVEVIEGMDRFAKRMQEVVAEGQEVVELTPDMAKQVVRSFAGL